MHTPPFTLVCPVAHLWEHGTCCQHISGGCLRLISVREHILLSPPSTCVDAHRSETRNHNSRDLKSCPNHPSPIAPVLHAMFLSLMLGPLQIWFGIIHGLIRPEMIGEYLTVVPVCITAAEEKSPREMKGLIMTPARMRPLKSPSL